MADFLPTDRPLTLTTAHSSPESHAGDDFRAGGGPDALLVAGFRGREAVSELFAFEFHLLAPVGNPPVALDGLLGQTVTAAVNPVPVPLGEPRTICGIVTAVRQGARDREFTHLYATVRPAWWYATLRTNSRVFQQVTVVEILKTVLGPFGPIDTRLAATYPARDFTCQYQESDFAFAARLMEEEGIFFSFVHENGKLTLLLADTLVNAAAADLRLPVRFDPESGPAALGREFRAWEWSKTRTVCPTAVTTWDSTFELFRQNLEADARPPETATAGEVTHTLVPPAVGAIPVYLHDGDSAKRFDGVAPGGGDQSADLQKVYADARRTARLRAEALAAAAVRVTGEANCPHLVPGTTFAVAGHYDADGSYVVLAAEHHAEFAATFRPGDGTAPTYRVAFEAGPPDLAPRPARTTPRPRVGGPLTAVVVGPAGQEIFVDRYGRVKIQFLWDRQGAFTAESSCWVRCAQVWAGKAWGGFFWPRVGMEVVVHFEDGDPDRPLITGCVYNATNVPPGDLPAEAAISGFKSRIVGATDPANQYNAVLIYDQADRQYVEVRSMTHEMRHSVRNTMEYTPKFKVSVNGTL